MYIKSKKEWRPKLKLIDYFLSNKERNGMHKPMAYFEIYEKHFSKFKNKKIKILEIGIENGGSLAMWKQYFGKGTEVVGIDINSKCKKFEEEGIKIYIGDQANEIFLAHVIGMEGGFDIVIDDGGHLMTQQITSFNILYESVRDSGVYLCEDTGTS
jgi:cephalosporin hydroxylase